MILTMTTSTEPTYQQEAVPNIFKELRVASGLSHARLALLMNTTKHALIRLEQGLYDRPLPTVVNWWLSEGRFLPGVKQADIRITELTLIDGYEEFQDEQRRRSYRYFGDGFNHLTYSAGSPHPCVQLEALARLSGLPCSEIGIAKALCVPQSTLNLWKRKYRTQQTVPKTVQSALMQIGYTRFEVKAFNDGYILWREANK